MNKKAVFLPLFVIVTLVILVLLSYTITKVKLSRQDKVGIKSLSIMKAYDEGEKDLLYLEQSLKLSKTLVMKELYDNGGYLSSNSCQKIKDNGDMYVLIDDSCNNFDIDNNFLIGLNNEFSSYIVNFRSTYEEFNPKNSFSSSAFNFLGLVSDTIVSERGGIFKTYSENSVKNSKIIGFDKDKSIVTLSDLNFKIENSLQSSYIIHPKIYLGTNDLINFNKVYQFIALNCINKEPNECVSKLNSEFKALTSVNRKIIIVKIPVNDHILKFAIDIDSKLPNVGINI